MKALGDDLHRQGLKFGIYSSPGDYTCGGYLGSLHHEKQDAATWNEWGVDYLKYDCCGYTRNIAEDPDKSAATQLEPYLKMERELRKQPRDFFYNVAWGAPMFVGGPTAWTEIPGAPRTIFAIHGNQSAA